MGDGASPGSWYVVRHHQIAKTHAAIKRHVGRYLPHRRGVAGFCRAPVFHFQRPSP
jgi:hypothetical protein